MNATLLEEARTPEGRQRLLKVLDKATAARNRASREVQEARAMLDVCNVERRFEDARAVDALIDRLCESLDEAQAICDEAEESLRATAGGLH